MKTGEKGKDPASPQRPEAKMGLDSKTYPRAEVVELPPPLHRGLTVEEAIKGRRSIRCYSSKSLSLSQLSELLFAAQGITGEHDGQPLRSAPSAGALYPIELYVAAHRVEDLAPGLYHYAVRRHALERIEAGDFRARLYQLTHEQDAASEANVVFILSAIYERVEGKYGARGKQYTHFEVGHISENITLEAVSLGLGSLTIGSFDDRRVNDLIGADGRRERALYLHAVGTR
jgi:SagB-type dehydrogenase family enzyme